MFCPFKETTIFFSSTLPLQTILHSHNISETVHIAIKKLQDPKGSKSEIKKMKLSAIFYLTQLGFSQYDISNMIDMKRTTVEGAINRVATTGTTLTGKSMGRPSSFDDYTKRHLERIIRSDPFQTIETLQGQLRSMSKNVSRTTVKNWVKKLGFKYRSAASKPKLSDDRKKTDSNGP
jgi:transposase